MYVHLGLGDAVIERFSRTEPSDREWASVFASDPRALFHSRAFVDQRSGSVFEFISAQLPLPAAPIDVYEIDTPRDLARWQAMQPAPRARRRATVAPPVLPQPIVGG